MAKRILFISYDGMTDPLGQSQVIPYLEGLAASGFDITILSAEKAGAFSKQSEVIREQLSSASIQWKIVKFSNTIPGWSAWRNYLRLKRQGVTLSKEEPFDIIHCRSYIPELVGLALKKRFGSKVLFDMRGFWPDERVEGDLWKLSNPFFKVVYDFFKKKEKLFFAESDAIVSLTENGKNEILSQEDLKVSPGKITVIPCCVDLHLFSKRGISASELDAIRTRLGITRSDFILSYSGSLGTWYLLDEMLHFFSLLLKRKPQSKFLFITGEPGDKVFVAARQRKIPEEKIIVVSAVRNQMPLMLSLSDLSIFFIKNTFSKKASCPTKFGETLAMEIPLVCNSGVGDVKEIIQESGAGISIDSFSEDALTVAVSAVDPLLKFPKEKIRDASVKYFSLEEGINKYGAIYAGL